MLLPFLLRECINYVSGDMVDFSKLCSAVCIVSVIRRFFFHVLVLVLRLFATVSASARTRERQAGHPGASLGSLSSQLWALIHIYGGDTNVLTGSFVTCVRPVTGSSLEQLDQHIGFHSGVFKWRLF